MKNNFLETFQNRFPKFGTNKSREIYRLICEISQIENISKEQILSEIKSSSYETVKNDLLKVRYPKSFHKTLKSSFFLPKYEIDKNLNANISKSKFNPKNIYYENQAKDSFVFANLKNKFPKANFTEIPSLKDFLKNTKSSNQSTLIKNFNNRCDNVFLIKEKYDFFKPCPCTSGVVKCGYSIMNIGMGCPFECSYCFLQGYQNVPGILFPYNIEEFLQETKIVSSTKGLFNYKRIGSGEFTDSLVFDNITNFSKNIISFFKTKPDIFFEFKTKSVEINNLLNIGGHSNIVVAWSLNANKMQIENEHKTPSILERLNSAKKVADIGFSTAFHFDPIIYFDGWKEGYKETIDMLFDIVPNESIKWISLGTLRMPSLQKTIIENRFDNSNILHGELLLGQDQKLRYHQDLRIEIYKYLSSQIKAKKSKAVVYLCMEDIDVYKKSNML